MEVVQHAQHVHMQAEDVSDLLSGLSFVRQEVGAPPPPEAPAIAAQVPSPPPGQAEQRTPAVAGHSCMHASQSPTLPQAAEGGVSVVEVSLAHRGAPIAARSTQHAAPAALGSTPAGGAVPSSGAGRPQYAAADSALSGGVEVPVGGAAVGSTEGVAVRIEEAPGVTEPGYRGRMQDKPTRSSTPRPPRCSAVSNGSRPALGAAAGHAASSTCTQVSTGALLSTGAVSPGPDVLYGVAPCRGLEDTGDQGVAFEGVAPMAAPAPEVQARPPARYAAEEKEYQRLMRSIVAPLEIAGLTSGGCSSGMQWARDEAVGDVTTASEGAKRGVDRVEAGATAGYAARYMEMCRGTEAACGTGRTGVPRPASGVAIAAADVSLAPCRGSGGRISPPLLQLPPEPPLGGGAAAERRGRGRDAAMHADARGAVPGHGAAREEHAVPQECWRTLGGEGDFDVNRPRLSRSLSPVPTKARLATAHTGLPHVSGRDDTLVAPAVASAACSYSISNSFALRSSVPVPPTTCMSPELRHVRPRSANAHVQWHEEHHTPGRDSRGVGWGCWQGGVAGGSPDVRELLEQREALLDTLERERLQLHDAKQRARELQADLQECSMTYEVGPRTWPLHRRHIWRSGKYVCKGIAGT